ncbi:MAG: hypothetical protein V4628_06810 [Pseudomonadota bacterium]
MRFIFKKMAIAALTLGLVSGVSAQEGHPVKGSWIGEWEGNPNGESILMVMDWDGDKITGVINPGTDDLKIDSATLNADDWTIHIEAGDYELDGKFERLELPNRSLTGTWKGDNDSGSFEVVRQ